MQYALFQQLRGEWSILYTYDKLSEAEADRLYYTKALGVPVQVFARPHPRAKPCPNAPATGTYAA